MILDYSLFQITSRMIWLECIVFKTVLTINAACRLIICQLEMPQKMTISDKSVSSVFIGNISPLLLRTDEKRFWTHTLPISLLLLRLGEKRFWTHTLPISPLLLRMGEKRKERTYILPMSIFELTETLGHPLLC